MRATLSYATVIMSIWTVCACSKNPASPPDARAQIYKGTESSSKQGIFRLGGAATCTAVQVARGILLTAGHCASANWEWREGQPERFVTYEHKANKQYSISKIVAAPFLNKNGVRIHPEDRNKPAFDLSVLFLANPDFTASDVLPLVDKDVEKTWDRLEVQLRVAGYGLTDDERSLPNLLETNMWFIANWGLFDQEIYLYSIKGNTCPGDSGGPVLHNGRVIGIVNAGTQWYKDTPVDHCFKEDTIATNLASKHVREWLYEVSEGEIDLAEYETSEPADDTTDPLIHPLDTY